MVPGTTEADYYQGKVTYAVPEQQEWVDARAAELPAEKSGSEPADATRVTEGSP